MLILALVDFRALVNFGDLYRSLFKSVVPSTRLFKSELSHTCTLVMDFGDLITKIYQSPAADVCRPRRGAILVCLAGPGKEARRLQDKRPPQQH